MLRMVRQEVKAGGWEGEQGEMWLERFKCKDLE